MNSRARAVKRCPSLSINLVWPPDGSISAINVSPHDGLLPSACQLLPRHLHVLSLKLSPPLVFNITWPFLHRIEKDPRHWSWYQPVTGIIAFRMIPCLSKSTNAFVIIGIQVAGTAVAWTAVAWSLLKAAAMAGTTEAWGRPVDWEGGVVAHLQSEIKACLADKVQGPRRTRWLAGLRDEFEVSKGDRTSHQMTCLLTRSFCHEFHGLPIAIHHLFFCERRGMVLWRRLLAITKNTWAPLQGFQENWRFVKIEPRDNGVRACTHRDTISNSERVFTITITITNCTTARVNNTFKNSDDVTSLIFIYS